MPEKFSWNDQYLMKDGRPWMPVMGEMHYSRYQAGLWEESLRKMKAGGVSIVSSYIFWIHHEEAEGEFDFTGCRDLGRFVRLCRKVGLYVFLRLGPWVHGETRNGGFPDRLEVKIDPLRAGADIYLEKWPEMTGGRACELKSAGIREQYCTAKRINGTMKGYERFLSCR